MAMMAMMTAQNPARSPVDTVWPMIFIDPLIGPSLLGYCCLGNQSVKTQV
jgi:hypothetical protein